jgi:ribonuclease HII
MACLAHVARAAGVDEAGRGALAGPVGCAAVILPEGFDLEGIDDSKKLTRDQREEQAGRIKEHACWAIALVPNDIIDEINILQATFLGMQMALAHLDLLPERVLIDGNQTPPPRTFDKRVTLLHSAAEPPALRFQPKYETFIQGDGLYACIAAASILAKTARDSFMRAAHDDYPIYGFDSHVGYSAPTHMEAIKTYGGCPLHRRSFDPLRTILEQPCLFDA